MPRIIHKCQQNNPYDCYYQKTTTGVWQFFDCFGCLINENHEICMFCGKSLDSITAKITTTPEKLHRCQEMIEIEKKRNNRRLSSKGNRFYNIEHLPSTGWTIMNNNQETQRNNLVECPFCLSHLPFFNQVIIE